MVHLINGRVITDSASSQGTWTWGAAEHPCWSFAEGTLSLERRGVFVILFTMITIITNTWKFFMMSAIMVINVDVATSRLNPGPLLLDPDLSSDQLPPRLRHWSLRSPRRWTKVKRLSGSWSPYKSARYIINLTIRSKLTMKSRRECENWWW